LGTSEAYSDSWRCPGRLESGVFEEVAGAGGLEDVEDEVVADDVDGVVV